MLWANFAYENGYDDERSDSESYAAIWPFEFALGTYLENIQRATSAGTERSVVIIENRRA
jgi:hypothetical protein